MNNYKNEVDLDTRISEYSRIKSKYLDRIPIIINFDKELSKLDIKKKYLVPNEVSCSYLMSIIRRRIFLNSSNALFMYCNNKLMSGVKLISEVYDEYVEDMRNDPDFQKGDKFLYVYISNENTFG